MITGLSHATLFVLDQDRALDFYTNKLGFEVRADMTMDGFRWLTVAPKGQQQPELILYPTLPGGPLDADALTHIRALLERGLLGAGVFQTDDCRKTFEQLRARGVEFDQEPQERPYGMEALFNDGCGNWFSLTQRF